MTASVPSQERPPPSLRTARLLLPFALLPVWLAVGGFLGPFAGRLGEVSTNDQAAFLPRSAGSTRVIPPAFLARIACIAASGVLLDTLVVRSLLVPALVRDIGRLAWWPGRLGRRPDAPKAPRTPRTADEMR
ncbi:MMPL family transporter [Streptomyces dangxiongensis]|uniref:MMPL family transporter n=1 Tax=Streptomyces dangxiongensis TaxID=1442032 RepID=UPI001F095333|nr:MMPL family transporter [Streptomyces dangxiongensis]